MPGRSPGSPRHHSRHKCRQHCGETGNIQIDHLLLPLGCHLHKAALRQHPGIVHQHIYLAARAFKCGRQPCCRSGLRQIGSVHRGGDAMLAHQLIRQSTQPAPTAGNQHQIMSGLCEAAGQRLANAGGCARDQRSKYWLVQLRRHDNFSSITGNSTLPGKSTYPDSSCPPKRAVAMQLWTLPHRTRHTLCLFFCIESVIPQARHPDQRELS